MAILLVAVVVIAGLAAGFMQPAKAATKPPNVTVARANTSLVCMWFPILKIGLC
ncbi:MAG: hypothetical protein JO148_06165 [Acidimicrobiia bacterium]|nr:hypothetical protein [Acidimicrobiia bacterium]